MRYRLIYLTKNIPVSKMCKIAKVSKSGYYSWLKHKDRIKNEEEILLIAKIFYQKKQKAGFRAIKMTLRKEYNIDMNHKKIVRIMKKYNLRSKIRRKSPYKTTMKASISDIIYPNIVDRNFDLKIPHSFYCTDITYMTYRNNNRAYLSALKDVASGEIVSWALSKNLKLGFVLETINKISSSSLKNSILTIHSDQGSHYRSREYQKLLKKYGIVQSMSRKGNCIDNAPIESFFGHMKDEIDYKQCETFEELEDLIDNYMHNYNNKRCQWNRNKMTPLEYKHYLLAS